MGILGTGSYLPSRVVGNDEVGARAGVDAEWILRKTGIGARRDADAHYFAMDGRAVRAFVTEQLPISVKEAVEEARTTAEDIRHFVPHQANGQMLDELQPSLGLRNAASHRTVAEYGNTGSASVPVTLDRANRSGALEDGDQVLLSGFGGGMSIGSAVLRWSRR